MLGVKYQTRIERFEIGDFAMVCVRSGRTDGVELRTARAEPASAWWVDYLFWPFDRIFVKAFSKKTIGLLPYAPGERDVNVVHDMELGIVISDAHPNFVNATKARQGRR